MPRKVRDSRLESRTARLRLPIRKKPYVGLEAALYEIRRTADIAPAFVRMKQAAMDAREQETGQSFFFSRAAR